jgi:hypothetical protein
MQAIEGDLLVQEVRSGGSRSMVNGLNELNSKIKA